MNQYLGSVIISGQDLIDLICNRKQTVMDYHLQFDETSLARNPILLFKFQNNQSTVDYKLLSGSIKVKGGKHGFEVSVLLADNLVELPDKRRNQWQLFVGMAKIWVKVFLIVSMF